MHLCSPLCTKGFGASSWGQNAILNPSTVKSHCRYTVLLENQTQCMSHKRLLAIPTFGQNLGTNGNDSLLTCLGISWKYNHSRPWLTTSTQPELPSSPSPVRALLGLNILKHCSLLIPSCLISWSLKGTTQDLSLSDIETLPSAHSHIALLYVPPPWVNLLLFSFQTLPILEQTQSIVSSFSLLISPPVSCLNWTLAPQRTLSPVIVPNLKLVNGVHVIFFSLCCSSLYNSATVL